MIGSPPRPESEQGAVLVLVALLSFGLLGLAGTVIDLGLVRQTQGAMQAATDAAALEGIRHRDSGTDLERRQRAQLAIARAFDDDLDLLNGDAIGFGAGPDIALTGTLANGRFGGLVTIDGEGDGDAVFDPRVAANVQNFQNGDLVAGVVDQTVPAVEDASYARTDFAPVPTANAGSAPAFLARLRRTPVAGDRLNPLDRQLDISTSGNAIPLLFARGSLTQGPIATDGVTVRATSIADGKAALAVSSVPASATAPERLVPGPATVFPTFSLSSVVLPALTSGPLIVTVQADGSLRAGVDPVGNVAIDQIGPMRIGRPMLATPSTRIPPDGLYDLIVPISDPIVEATETAIRVTGFRRLRTTVVGSSWTFELDARPLLSSGATALDPTVLRVLTLLPTLRERFLQVAADPSAAVLAPRLAR